MDIDRLTDLPESIDLLALTRAAVHPADRHAWLAVLRAPWIGLDWADIHALVENDDAGTIPELLADRERVGRMSKAGRAALAKAQPCLEDLSRPRRFESLRDVVERAWLRLGGPLIPDSPDAIDNVYRLLDVIGKLEQAGTELARFVVNSTVGFLGFTDPAAEVLDLQAYPEDFGQTLGHYGVGSGFHLVLPLLGPSNLRDTLGLIPDHFLDPVNYIDHSETAMAVRAYRLVNKTSLHLGEYESLKKDAVDLYPFLRDAYEQRRKKQILE